MPRNEKVAREQMAQWHAMRRKEQQRAMAIEAERPERKFKDGQHVEIQGRAVVRFADVHGSEDSDHQGAVGIVEQAYWGTVQHPDTWCYFVRTETNMIRGIPERRLRHINLHKRVARQ